MTALWSQLWAFLGWYNAVQLVPRHAKRTAWPGDGRMGLPVVDKVVAKL